MEYTKELDGTTLTVALNGRLDTETAPAFETNLMPSLAGVTSLVIDMSELDYISSSGLRVLLSLKKKMIAQGGDLCVVKVCESIMSIFRMAGFDMVLNVK